MGGSWTLYGLSPWAWVAGLQLTCWWGQEEWSRWRVGQRWGSRTRWDCSRGGRVPGCCHLRVGGIESPPLVIKNGGFALPLSPSPRHWAQLVNALPQVGVEHLLEVVDQSDIS